MIKRNDHIIEGIFFRWIASTALLLGVYNPSEFSYYYWVTHATSHQIPYLIVVGVLFLISIAVFARATLRSLGVFGILSLVVLFGALIWSALNLGWVRLSEHNLLFYLAIAFAAFILAIGSYWSIIRRKFSGQLDATE